MSAPKKKTPAKVTSATTLTVLSSVERDELNKLRELTKQYLGMADYDELCLGGKRLYREAAILTKTSCSALMKNIAVSFEVEIDLTKMPEGFDCSDVDNYSIEFCAGPNNVELEVDNLEVNDF